MIKRYAKALWMIAEAVLFSILLTAIIFVFKLGWFIHIILAIGTVLAIVLTHARWKKPFRPTRLSSVPVYILFLALFWITQVVIWQGFTGIKRHKTFEMSWSYGEPSTQWPDCQHIILTFVDYPNHRIGIYSKNLGKYLESLPQPSLPVEFETTWDFGKMRGYFPNKIGNLTDWHSAWGHGGVSGDYDPSPWDDI